LRDEDSILKSVRGKVVGSEDNMEFDKDLLPHINSSLSILNQNGVGLNIIVTGEEETWGDFKDSTQTEGNKMFQMVPMYVMLNTNILFDPPPPSNVEYHHKNISELLWRLKIAYEPGSEEDE